MKADFFLDGVYRMSAAGFQYSAQVGVESLLSVFTYGEVLFFHFVLGHGPRESR